MKAILEPNEILIQVRYQPNESPSGYYYMIQTGDFFKAFTDPNDLTKQIKEEVLRKENLLRPKK